MILLRAEDHPVLQVAQLTRCSPDLFPSSR
jgi:hypothetical protein